MAYTIFPDKVIVGGSTQQKSYSVRQQSHYFTAIIFFLSRHSQEKSVFYPERKVLISLCEKANIILNIIKTSCSFCSIAVSH